jgi:hypothetical protein
MVFLWRRKAAAVAALLAVAGLVWWEIAVGRAVLAVASLSDPIKLATLGPRGANPRLNKIVYWLDDAHRLLVPPGFTIGAAQIWNGTHQPRAGLVKAELLRNLKIAAQLGLLTRENRDHLKRGHSAVISRGPYAGEPAEIDHIVPLSLAPEVGNELANLEMLPKTLNRQKSNHVSARQLDYAAKFLAAGLLSRTSFERLQAKGASKDR